MKHPWPICVNPHKTPYRTWMQRVCLHRCVLCVCVAALVHQSLKVPWKDLRQFLDGVYVSEKGTVRQPKWSFCSFCVLPHLTIWPYDPRALLCPQPTQHHYPLFHVLVCYVRSWFTLHWIRTLWVPSITLLYYGFHPLSISLALSSIYLPFTFPLLLSLWNKDLENIYKVYR